MPDSVIETPGAATADQTASPSESKPRRRPYEAPAIEETAEFETLALTCAQNVGPCSDPYNGGVQYSNS
jgi:hypothetical protein